MNHPKPVRKGGFCGLGALGKMIGKILGQKKDVAYVTYYLVGDIIREGKDDITNYRTRASNVMEKKGGKWVNSGAHYSPLFGGSGVE